VHSDVNHKYPAIPFGIVVNTYLQDSDEKNGVTEVSVHIRQVARPKLTSAIPGLGWYSQCIRERRPASYQGERLDQERVHPETSQSAATSPAEDQEREHLLP
jgi:hypothetical protein